jgi:hypothetical protein
MIWNKLFWAMFAAVQLILLYSLMSRFSYEILSVCAILLVLGSFKLAEDFRMLKEKVAASKVTVSRRLLKRLR